MTKNEFIVQLKRHLRGLPQEETEAAVAYYSEYISDAGSENEESAIAALGSPAEIAAQIVANFAAQPMAVSEESAKKGISKFWIVLLAIFASPIALPLAIVAAAVAVVLLVALLTILISFFAGGIALVAGGVAYGIVGLVIIPQDAAMAVFACGGGLLAIGLGLLLTKATAKLSKVSFNGLAQGFGKFILRSTAK